ncbi:MAG: P-loop NTPase, partial [Pseudomonadota bacterium]
MNPFDQQKPIEGIKKILAVGSGKGGVGKSTVSVNLAAALKKQGFKVGLLDADIYGPSLPRLLGALGQKPQLDENNKILPIVRQGMKLMSIGFLIDEDKAVVWRGPMLFKAMDQFFRDVAWGELDYLLIDLPPGTGDIALTAAQKVPINGAITVCTPQNLAFVDAKKAIDMFDQINVPHLGVVENMAYFKASPDADPVSLFPAGDMSK